MGSPSSLRAPLLAAIGLSLGVAGGLFSLDAVGVFDGRDLGTWDLLFRLRGERVASERIALVAVDDETIRAYGRWPLPRDTYALLLEALREAGASAIGLDLLFLDRKEEEARFDLLLAAVTKRAHNVVHAVTVASGGSASGGEESASDVIRSEVIEQGRVAVPAAGEIARPFRELTEAAGALGHVAVLVDDDGRVRRVPLLLRSGAELHPALALRLVGIAEGWPDPLRVRPSDRGFTVSTGEDQMTFVADEEGGTAFDFAGDKAAFPETHPLLDVLRKYRDGRSEELKKLFAGRIVLVGVTAVGEAAADVGSTPFAAATPLVYAHANLVDALLNDRILRDAPAMPTLLGTTLAAVGLGIALMRLPMAGAVASTIVAFGLIGLGEFLLLTRFGIRFPPTAPLLVPPLSFLAITVYRLVFLERNVREWEPVFSALHFLKGKFVRAPIAEAETSGRQMGHYRLEEIIGRGGMGEVWRASHLMLDRPAAVKLIRRSNLGLQDAAQALALLRRFEREVQATAGLESEHTVKIYDFGVEQDSTFYYAMELLEGVNLDELVRRFGPSPPERTVHLLLQACDALDDAHRRRFVHRDVKPANILTCRHGGRVDHVKVLDFGLVKRRERMEDDSALTREGSLAGTPSFISPEQALGKTELDARADLYSLGCVAYWLLTGSLVFERENPMEQLIAHVREPPVPPSRRSERPVPGDVENLVMWCLEKDPERRPPSAPDLAARLRGCECCGRWTVERASQWWDRHLPLSAKPAARRTTHGETRHASLEGSGDETRPV